MDADRLGPGLEPDRSRARGGSLAGHRREPCEDLPFQRALRDLLQRRAALLPGVGPSGARIPDARAFARRARGGGRRHDHADEGGAEVSWGERGVRSAGCDRGPGFVFGGRTFLSHSCGCGGGGQACGPDPFVERAPGSSGVVRSALAFAARSRARARRALALPAAAATCTSTRRRSSPARTPSASTVATGSTCGSPTHASRSATWRRARGRPTPG